MKAANAGVPEPVQPNVAPSLPQPVSRSTAMAIPRPGAWPMSPAGLNPSPDTRAILKALGRRWLLALSLGLLCAGGVAAAAWYLFSPKYTAFAQVRVAAIRPWVVKMNADTPEGRNEFDTYKRFQASHIRSRFILNETLKQDDIKRLKLVREQPEPIPFLEEELKVQIKDGSELIGVSLSGTDPSELLTLVRAVVGNYLTKVVVKEQDEREKRVAELEKTYNSARAKLHRKRESLKQASASSGGDDPQALNQKQLMLLTTFGELKKQHAQIQFELMQTQAKLAAHKSKEKLLGSVLVPESAINVVLDADPIAKQHLVKLARWQDIITEYEQTAKDPQEATLVRARKAKRVLEKALDARRDEIRLALQKQFLRSARDEYNATLASLQSAIAPLTEQEKTLRHQVEQHKAEAAKVGTSSTAMDLLRGEIKQEEHFVSDLANKLALFRVEVGAGPRVTLFQDADLQKIDGKKRLMAAIGGPVATLFLVCFGVGWWEYRGRRIRSTDEVSTSLGMRVVGAIPAISGPAAGKLMGTTDPLDGSEDHLLESIDAIRTMLLRDASMESTRVVMVTSAVAGEGKTTLASNLATSLARAGRKTLLIDCDLRCPAAHQLFEQTLQPGFSEILLGEVDLVDAIRPTTAIEGLWLIPAGQWDREVIQALAKTSVQDIFDRLKEEFDFIVVDSHPVLGATDSLLLGQYADAVLLSLMRDVSQVPRVHAAGQKLMSLGIRVLGAVVNGVPAEATQQGYPYPVTIGTR